jgi:DNA polymerase (family 10)
MSLNAQVASILYEISEILTIKGDRFRSRAYSMASQRVTALTEDVRDIAARGELEQIPGVGKSIALTIEEFLDSGESIVLQELRESLPQGVPEMITLEGIGPKIAMRLHQELGVVGIKTLEEAAKQHRIRELKGFGPKKEENIIKAIEEHRSRSTRFLLGEVLPVIQGMLMYMRDCKAVRKVEMAGSARRRKETVGDLDVLVSSTDPETVTAHFVSMPPIGRVLAQGPTKSTVVLENMLQVDLRVIPPESYGAALQYFTGSKEHNVKLRTLGVKAGFKLNEYGLFRRQNDELVEAEDETRIYEALGMRWMPPELRENAGEIEAAMEDRLPELVTLDDIRGDLHVHTGWSDGHASIA